MNYETVGVTFAREEGHSLFMRQIKSPRGVISHGFKGTGMVEDSWYNGCVIMNNGSDVQQVYYRCVDIGHIFEDPCSDWGVVSAYVGCSPIWGGIDSM